LAHNFFWADKALARYKIYDYRQRVLLPVSLEEQLMPGTLEFAIHTLVEKRLDLAIFAGKYRNDEPSRAAYDPKVGLSAEGERWIAARNRFLLPVRALSKIIRAKFLEALEKAFREDRLKGTLPCLADPAHFQRFTRKLRRKKGVVYAKGTFEASQKAYHYLSRYTHRVAIANHHLVSLTEGKVSFRARDNSPPGHQRLVTTAAPGFIRRFLLHVLPRRFVKIRHYGLMAPCNAKTKLEKARVLLSLQQPPARKEPKGQELDTSSETKT
jgi:hypothetical protein